MNKLIFNDEVFNDDRMYVLYVSKCTVEEDDKTITTTIHHVTAPTDHIWCVVTYKNIPRYKAVRVDHFLRESEAMLYVKSVEPQTPLISLYGKSPVRPLTYIEFSDWKKLNQFCEYDYKKMYLPGGTNPMEIIVQPKK